MDKNERGEYLTIRPTGGGGESHLNDNNCIVGRSYRGLRSMQSAADATAALLTETALNCGSDASYHCDESAYQRCMSAPLSQEFP